MTQVESGEDKLAFHAATGFPHSGQNLGAFSNVAPQTHDGFFGASATGFGLTPNSALMRSVSAITWARSFWSSSLVAW
jgi:hypothetical protein